MTNKPNEMHNRAIADGATPREAVHNSGALLPQFAMTSPPLLRIGDQPISLAQAIAYLQRGELFDSLVGEVVRQYMLDQALAQQPQLAPDAIAVGEAVAQFRQQQQLTGSDAFTQWLEGSGLTEAQLQGQIATGLHLEELKAAIALPQLQPYFIERKLFLDRVVLSRIIVEDKDLIEELHCQLADGTSFESLAQEFSITDDGIVNGMVGPVSRGSMPDALRAVIDEAQEGQVVGPITMDERWGLFRVEAVLPASLDNPALKQALTDELFEQWLAAQMEALPIQLEIAP